MRILDNGASGASAGISSNRLNIFFEKFTAVEQGIHVKKTDLVMKSVKNTDLVILAASHVVNTLQKLFWSLPPPATRAQKH